MNRDEKKRIVESMKDFATDESRKAALHPVLNSNIQHRGTSYNVFTIRSDHLGRDVAALRFLDEDVRAVEVKMFLNRHDDPKHCATVVNYISALLAAHSCNIGPVSTFRKSDIGMSPSIGLPREISDNYAAFLHNGTVLVVGRENWDRVIESGGVPVAHDSLPYRDMECGDILSNQGVCEMIGLRGNGNSIFNSRFVVGPDDLKGKTLLVGNGNESLNFSVSNRNAPLILPRIETVDLSEEDPQYKKLALAVSSKGVSRYGRKDDEVGKKEWIRVRNPEDERSQDFFFDLPHEFDASYIGPRYTSISTNRGLVEHARILGMEDVILKSLVTVPGNPVILGLENNKNGAESPRGKPLDDYRSEWWTKRKTELDLSPGAG